MKKLCNEEYFFYWVKHVFQAQVQSFWLTRYQIHGAVTATIALHYNCGSISEFPDSQLITIDLLHMNS